MKDEKVANVLKIHSVGVEGVAAFLEARKIRVARYSKDQTVRIWDAMTGGEAVQVLTAFLNEDSRLPSTPRAPGWPVALITGRCAFGTP